MQHSIKQLLPVFSAVVCFCSLVLLLVAGPGYRFELWQLGTAITLLSTAAICGLAGAGLSVLFAAWLKPRGTALVATALLTVAGLAAFLFPYQLMRTARSVPPIHDISTDLTNPPAFREVLPLRAGAPNPAAYAGAEVARQQREAYRDITTQRFDLPPDRVFDATLAIVEGAGWELVASVRDEGRIEATATTPWFGFKDDVVIRIAPEGNQTRLDIRSKSRVGKSDLGTNAQRIRKFIRQLNARFGRPIPGY